MFGICIEFNDIMFVDNGVKIRNAHFRKMDANYIFIKCVLYILYLHKYYILFIYNV